MKRVRKGFTLVELLIVIGIISILGTMAMIGGTEANNIAQANKIVDEFKIIGAAMQMYYADNTKEATATAITATTIKTGITPYMKDVDSIVVDTATVGKYLITIVNGEWWLTYTLQADDTKIGAILQNKATQEGLKKNTTTSETSGSTTSITPADAYDGKASVCYKVR